MFIGIVGKKIGMSHLYDDKGVRTPVTLIEPYECCVSDFKVNDNKDYNKVVLSYKKVKNPDKKISKSVRGIYKKKSLEPYRSRKEFVVAKGVEYKVGTLVTVNDAEDGLIVSATGISKGKGFAGPMKRWNFAGLDATHGVSVSHRSHGSTGQRQDPGKVFKGKKMAGHMGNKQVTVKNLQIVHVDKEDNIICIKGAVPGHRGSDVIIKVQD